MKILLDVLVSITTLISGFYWYKSSKVLVGPGTGGEGDVEIICSGDGTRPPWEVVGTIRDQTKLNKTAASWAVITAVLVVINLIIQNLTTNSICK